MQNKLACAICVALLASTAQAQDSAQEKFMTNWDLNGDGEIPLAEALEMRTNIFAAFDSNQDGALSDEEYDMFDAARANDMASVSADSRARLRKIVGGLSRKGTDQNGDGRVTRQEFLDSTAQWHAGIDKTGDGVITIEDFAIAD
jgi:Ca2+-binding EF-hand superfamily protein